MPVTVMYMHVKCPKSHHLHSNLQVYNHKNASLGKSRHFYKNTMITVKKAKRYLTHTGNTEELGPPIGQGRVLLL